MENIKIRTEEEFNEKLNEIENIFGIRFEKEGFSYYVNIKDKKLKMTRTAKDGWTHYYVTDGSQRICFKSLFSQHMFSTSALIEIYISNGENRILCSLKQELRPECGSGEMPEFMYAEYINGKSHSFYSNAHQVETIESNTLDNLMLSKMIEYDDIKTSDSVNNDKKMFETRSLATPSFNKMVEYRDLKIGGANKNKKLTRFLFGIYCGMYNICSGSYKATPAVHLDIINDMKGNSFNLWEMDDTLIYNEIKRKYKHDSDIHYEYLPFLKTIQRKTLKQIISDFNYDEKTLKEFEKYMMSIVRNPEAIRNFNNSIEYFQNSLAWPYISKYYSNQIDYIRKIQNGEIEYICEPQKKKIGSKLQIKLLKK